MKRHHVILSVVLALQVVLAVLVLWPRATAEVGGGELLLEGFDPQAIRDINLQDSDGNRILIGKVAGAWVLPEADNFPCDATKVDAIVEKLYAINTSRLVTRTEASHTRLKVASDDFERRIELSTTAGNRMVLYLGTSPNFGAIHVRVEGQVETYMTSEVAAHELNTAASSWIDTSYLTIPKEEIQQISLKNVHGAWAFDRDDEGTWTMLGLEADEQVNTTTMANLENRIASIRMQTPLGLTEIPQYGMQDPSAVVTIRTPDKTITLRVGAQDSTDNSYVVRSSESAYFVRVAEFAVADLVEKTREDFVETVPTPTPGYDEPTPSPESGT